MILYMGNGLNVLPLCFLLVLLRHAVNGWHVSPGGQQQQHDDSRATQTPLCRTHAEKTGRRILEEESVFAGCRSSSRHAAGAKTVPLYSDGLDQLLHPADLRGHLLSQDLIAAFQAPKLAL